MTTVLTIPEPWGIPMVLIPTVCWISTMRGPVSFLLPCQATTYAGNDVLGSTSSRLAEGLSSATDVFSGKNSNCVDSHAAPAGSGGNNPGGDCHNNSNHNDQTRLNIITIVVAAVPAVVIIATINNGGGDNSGNGGNPNSVSCVSGHSGDDGELQGRYLVNSDSTLSSIVIF